MTVVESHRRWSVEEYLAFEAESPIRHEYVAGEIYAMSGVADAHNRAAINLLILLQQQLRAGPCEFFISDVKLRVEAADAYFYPDVFVTCDPRDALDPLVKRHAKLVVEVLSDSTEAYDRGQKFLSYQRLDSLQEYVLVDSHERQVEVFRRAEDGAWTYRAYGPEDTLRLESVGLEARLGDVYEGVRLEPRPPPSAG